MTNAEKHFIYAAKRLHREATAVKDWMNDEGKKGYLRTNKDCPTWSEYCVAKESFDMWYSIVVEEK